MSDAVTIRLGRWALPLVLVPALLLVWAATALAAPRFTDKDTALELARVLDKGVFRGKLISSTFVHSPDVGAYQIKVVLDDGTELNWSIEQIRLWSQDDSITLPKNRVLVFPKADTNEFGILDKNEFTRKVLRAQVYARQYESSDVMAGRVIHFAMHRFNLVDLLRLHPGRDDMGNLYRYVLDFKTGERVFLSYLGAWRALNRNGLMESPGSEPVMTDTYRLQAMEPVSLRRNVGIGSGTFGFTLRFDRTVELRPEHFPFRMHERRPTKGKGALDNTFVLEVTAPNAVMANPVPRVDAMEYLNDIQAVPDGAHQNRVLLRAMVAPEVLTHPPEVEVQGNAVTVLFTKVEDQSVFDRKALHEAELRRKQEKLLAPVLTPEEVEQRRLYRSHMESGLGQLDKARAEPDPATRYETLLASLANFREAAIVSSSDLQLEEALRQRNGVADRLPGQIIALANQISEGGAGDRGRVLSLLKAAEQLTQDPEVLTALREAARRLGG